MEAVLGYYGDVVAVKRQILEFDVERIVVDHDTVVTEGWIHTINLGTVARARGWDVDDDDASYLVSQRVVIFWPFDDEGRMVGEDGYANFDRTQVRKLAPEELPDAYTGPVRAGLTIKRRDRPERGRSAYASTTSCARSARRTFLESP